MNQDKYVFAQLTSFLNRTQFNNYVRKYDGNKYVQHDMDLKRSTYEVLGILSISLTDKVHLRDLFDKTNFNDVKEQFVPLIPGLFD